MEVLYYTVESTLLDELVYLSMALVVSISLFVAYIKEREFFLLISAIIALLLLSAGFYVKYNAHGFAEDKITYHVEVQDIYELTKHDCKISHQGGNVWTATDCDLSSYIK